MAKYWFNWLIYVWNTLNKIGKYGTKVPTFSDIRIRGPGYFVIHFQNSTLWIPRYFLISRNSKFNKNVVVILMNSGNLYIKWIGIFLWKYCLLTQRVLNRWSHLSEQKLRLFSKVKLKKNEIDKKWWAYWVYIRQNKVRLAVIIYY